MRKTITIKGLGATSAQARNRAYAQLKDQYKNNVLVYGLLNTQMVVEPKPAKQSTTTNNPPTGARKWETVYKVMGKNPATNELKQLGDFYPGKTEALKAAKELSVKHQIVCEVHIAKIDRGVNANNVPNHVTAIVTPKMTEGAWDFTLDIEVIE